MKVNYINNFLSRFNLKVSKIYKINNSKDSFLMNVEKRSPYGFFLRRDIAYYGNLRSVGFKFFFDEYKNVITQFKDIRMYILSVEDLFILNEIYYEGRYNFYIPKDCVVIDIGMNSGFATLFFASSQKVQKIFSYEPVVSTYSTGLNNLNLNLQLKKKVEAYNFGVGGINKVEEFIFSEEWKGSVGLRSLSEVKKASSKNLEKISVDIHDVAEVISNARSFGLPVVAKIDCEGAEYEIIDRLNKLDEIPSIDLYMIEWHDKGPQRIEEVFHHAGLATMSFYPYLNKDLGMLYACKYSAGR